MLVIKRKRSHIWKIPQNEFANIIKHSNTLSDVIRKCGLRPIGNNHQTIKRRIEEDKIDISHIPMGLGSNKGRRFGGVTAKPLEEILIKESTYSRCHLKRRLIKANLLKEECIICGQKPEWKGKKLVLVLDHINGTNNDNRIKNLRLLCPNCNSQTDTFAGRSNLTTKGKICKCGNKKRKESKRCIKCSSSMSRPHKRKVKRPSYIILVEEIKQQGYSAIGRKYGVSDNAIRKWIKHYEKNM